MRLYVRVASWLRETGREASPEDYPLCLQPYTKVVAPVSGRPVHDHLRETLGEDKAFLAKTLKARAESARGMLGDSLDQTLSNAMRRDLPSQPMALIEAALTGELFAGACFTGVLAPLRRHAEELCRVHLPALPAFVEPPSAPLSAPWRTSIPRLRCRNSRWLDRSRL